MTDGSTRRALLRTGAVVSVTGLCGCLGLGDSPGCDDAGVVAVLASRLRGWYVSYPATTGLFDIDGEDREAPARRLATLAREAGYTAEYYYAEDYGRYQDDDSWQVELYGELDRSRVRELVRRARMPDPTDIAERTATLSRGSELSLPWSPGLLDGRASFLAEHAPRLGVSLPAFGPMNGTRVTLTERPDEATLEWLRSTLSGRGVLRVAIRNVPKDDDPLTDEVVSNYHVDSREREAGYFEGDSVTLRSDGTVTTDIYIEPLLKTVYRPRREDDLPYLEQARLAVSLDGRRLTERPLTDAEQAYLRAYRDYIDADDTLDREAPAPPDLTLTTLEGRTALRTAALLEYPEDAQFGVAVEQCDG